MERLDFKKEKIPFTQIANEVLCNPKLSAKAKGLYAYLYSKPDGWDFAVDRIKKEFNDGRLSINTGLQELEREGYLLRQRENTGRVVYLLKSQMSKIDIRELDPNVENRKVRKSQSAKIDIVSNTDIKVIKSISNKEYIYMGEFENVKLTLEEFEKVKEKIQDYQTLIENLSSYMKSKGKKYSSHYATLLNWNNRNEKQKNFNTKSIKLI